MSNTISQSFIQLMQNPGCAFSLYLLRNDVAHLELNPSEGYRVDDIFCEAMTYLLFQAGAGSGFTNMTFRTQANPSDQTLLVRWESGTSEQKRLDKAHMKKLRFFIQTYYQYQLEQYRAVL